MALNDQSTAVCSKVDFGSYDRTVLLRRPKHMYPTENGDWITVDNCMVPEILKLWREGIWTLECCCGHGKVSGYIAVHDDSRQKLEAMGYTPNKDAPHVYDCKTVCDTKPSEERMMACVCVWDGDKIVEACKAHGDWKAAQPATPTDERVRDAVEELDELYRHQKVEGYHAKFRHFLIKNYTLMRDALTAATSPKQDDIADGMPCVCCGNPSDTATPDDADMCWKCFGEFNATEYDNIKDIAERLAGALRDIDAEAQKPINGHDALCLLGVIRHRIREALSAFEKQKGRG